MRWKLAITFALLGTAATAMGDFGTEDEAREIASELTQIIQSGGVDAGIAAMHDPARPFVATNMGVHILEHGILVADNREPELVATAYSDIPDLTGEPMWPRIVAAADTNSEAIVEWFHYETEAEYTYHCYSEWSVPGDVLVMVCR